MPCVVVLGGTGWVGRHVCSAFSQRGYDVVAVARSPVPGIAAGTFIGADLAAAGSSRLRALLADARADIVVNATDGANARDGWRRSEAELVQANVGLVQGLLSGMAALHHRPRLVHIGTIHEYGPVPGGTPIDEEVRPAPVTVYSRTKLAGSQAVLDSAAQGRVEGVVLRLANVCGPHPSPESFPGKLLAMLRRAAAEHRPLSVGISAARRDYVDVRDVAEAVVRAGEVATHRRVFNIGSGTAVTARELVETFVVAAGFPVEMIRETAGPPASLGGDWTQADIRLAAEHLSWVPRTTLAESLRAAWEEPD